MYKNSGNYVHKKTLINKELKLIFNYSMYIYMYNFASAKSDLPPHNPL